MTYLWADLQKLLLSLARKHVLRYGRKCFNKLVPLPDYMFPPACLQ